MPDEAQASHNFQVQLDQLQRAADLHLADLGRHVRTVHTRLDGAGPVGRGIAAGVSQSHTSLTMALVGRLWHAEAVVMSTAGALRQVADLYRAADGAR